MSVRDDEKGFVYRIWDGKLFTRGVSSNSVDGFDHTAGGSGDVFGLSVAPSHPASYFAPDEVDEKMTKKARAKRLKVLATQRNAVTITVGSEAGFGRRLLSRQRARAGAHSLRLSP